MKWSKLSSSKLSKIAGYEIQYSTDKNFTASSTKTVKVSKSKTSKKVSKLKSGKIYYVRVRTYKTIDGVKHVSKWSTVKKVKTK